MVAFNPLDAFTGAPAVQAGIDARNAITGIGTNVGNIAGAASTGGIAALQAGQYGALGSIIPGYAQARTDVMGATGTAADALYGGQNLASGAISGSVDPALAALRGGVTGVEGAYNPLLTAAGQYGSFGTPSAQMIADANGVNGPEGIARAQAAFHTSPGYSFQLGQGIDAATRSANASGVAAGGNTLAELTRYGQGVANQDYGNWLTRLQQQSSLYSPLEANVLSAYGQGVGNARLTGGTGAANILTGTGKSLADLYSGTGGTAANLYANSGNTLANLAAGGGTAAANVYTGTGQNIASLLAGLSGQQIGFQQSTVAPTVKSYEDAAQAQMLGASNLWGLGLAGATAGAKIAGAGGFGAPYYVNPTQPFGA